MPTLEWIGKDKVINHHQEVPYRVLDELYTYGAEKSQNMIVHGDNLEALKALLPRYEGLVKCIYIDPPYNTGNEGWVYNDNVNDPKIRKWLGTVVGKEGEDLSRHDKWLCMMYPRLKLMQKLLHKDGAIFISIDDNEQANLKLICDEIFGNNCFVSNLSWQRTYSTRNDSKGIVNEVEHILVYSKQPNWIPNLLPRTEAMDAKYKNPDNDIMPWTSSDAFAADAATHQGMVYAVQHPFTGKMVYPSNGAHWRYQQDAMLNFMREWANYELQDLDDAKERAHVCGVPLEEVRQGVLSIVLSDPLQVAASQAQTVYDRGQWPRFYFTKGGQGGVRRKTYLENVGGRLPTNLWQYNETGHTDEAKKQMLSIFDGRATFDTPKPTRLLDRILHIAGDNQSLILDAFAGSGTTAHAVLNANKADSGNRKFILIESMDYAETITAERVRRVINGYGEGNSTVVGTGGSFSFYTMGDTILLPDGNINEDIALEKIQEYIWFTETKQPMPEHVTKPSPYYLGEHGGTDYYFYYERDIATTLDYDFLNSIEPQVASHVIYADRCEIPEDKLKAWGIIFKKIPRDIAKL